MSYRFEGIECDTAEEALALSQIGSARVAPTKSSPAKPAKSKTTAGNDQISKKKKQWWKEVRALAKKEGIGIRDAMAKMKKPT